MKRIIIGAALAGIAAVAPLASTFAIEPVLPPCSLSLGPTVDYSTVSLICAPYTDPNTGLTYNGITIETPPPSHL